MLHDKETKQEGSQPPLNEKHAWSTKQGTSSSSSMKFDAAGQGNQMGRTQPLEARP
jgi:hypothetical protein